MRLRSSILRRLIVMAIFSGVWIGRDSTALAWQPVPPQKEPPAQNEPPVLDPVLAATLSHSAFQDRDSVTGLQRAMQLFELGQPNQGFVLLQALMGDPQEILGAPRDLTRSPMDSLIWDEKGLRTVRSEVRRLFENMPDEQLAQYDRQFGSMADEALEDARREGSLAALNEVTRRFFPTRAGFAASDEAATRLLDQGYVDSAAALWFELIDSNLHQQRLAGPAGLSLLRKAAMAQILAGHIARAETVIAKARSLTDDVSFNLESLAEAARGIRIRQTDDGLVEWLQPFGDPRHGRQAGGSAPYLQAMWTRPVARDQDFVWLSEWDQARADSELHETAVAVWPIIARGQLIVRDLYGIRGYHPHTGALLWEFNATLSAPQLASILRNAAFAGSNTTAVEYGWIGNAMQGAVTSDGDHVFAIDWTSLEPDPATFAVATPPNAGQTDRRLKGSNRVVCLDISGLRPLPEQSAEEPAAGAAVAADPGSAEVPQLRPQWSIDGSTADSPLHGHVFLGAPLPVGDAVFVVTEHTHDRELNLVKLEAATGRLLWIQGIGLVELPFFDYREQYRQMPMCLPAYSGRYVVCPTDAGYVVAVDAVSGSLQWMFSYEDRRLPSRLGNTFRDNFGHRGLPDPPHIANGNVYLLPRHSRYIHCVDLQTGHEVWRAPRDDDRDHYIAAVTKDSIAIVGREGLRGLSLQDGTQRWEARLGLPSGRGVQVGPDYLVPLKAGGIGIVNLRTGRASGSGMVPSRLDRLYLQERHPEQLTSTLRDRDLAGFGLQEERVAHDVRPGNLLLHDGLVISQGPRHLTVFPQAASYLTELHQREKNGQPVDELLVSRLEIAFGMSERGYQRLEQLMASQSPQAEQAQWQMRRSLFTRLKMETERLEYQRALARKQQADQAAAPNASRTVAPPAGEPGIDADSTTSLEIVLSQTPEATVDVNAGDDPDGSAPRSSGPLSPEDGRKLLARLDSLSVTPTERSEVRFAQLSWEMLNRGGWERVIGIIHESVRDDAQGFVATIGGVQNVVSIPAWTRGHVTAVFGKARGEYAELAARLIDEDIQSALASGSTAQLARVVYMYEQLPQTGAIRNRLADRLVAEGRLQQAELLLLKNRSHDDPQVRAVAEALLVALWHRSGLNGEAGRAAVELARRYPGTSLGPILREGLTSIDACVDRQQLTPFAKQPDQFTVAEFLNSLRKDTPTWDVTRNLQPVPWTVNHIAITTTSESMSLPATAAIWERAPRRVVDSREVELDLVRQGTTLESEWLLLDRVSGTDRGIVKMPGRFSLPNQSSARFVGHLLPVGSPAQLQGLSLLEFKEQKPLWERSFPIVAPTQELCEPGPALPAVCIFQTRRHLFGVDPANGQVLWRRSDLDQASGVFVDKEVGLFGDEQVLVMFHNDQHRYTMFETRTGRVMRVGRQNIDFRYPRFVFGRKLVYATRPDDHGNKWLCIWDPLTDTYDLNELQVGRPFFWPDGDELTLLTGSGLLRVFHMPDMRVTLSMEFGFEDLRSVTSLRTFSDEQTVYLNLQRSHMQAVPGKHYFLASDSPWPLHSIYQGSLLAIDRKTGRIRWNRDTQQTSVLEIREASLPFLVTASRTRPRDSNTQQHLEIEAIHCVTGETLAVQTSLLPDRIIRCTVNQDTGVLSLHGLTSRIDLDYSARYQRILLEQQGL